MPAFATFSLITVRRLLTCVDITHIAFRLPLLPCHCHYFIYYDMPHDDAGCHAVITPRRHADTIRHFLPYLFFFELSMYFDYDAIYVTLVAAEFSALHSHYFIFCLFFAGKARPYGAYAAIRMLY